MILPRPTVVVHNNLEVFFRFLKRSEDASLIYQRRFRGDRALFWLGTPKLVCTTAPTPGASWITAQYGFSGTRTLTPANTSCQLSLDLIQDADALDQIAAFAAPSGSLDLVPYAATPEFYQLAAALRQNYGLDVRLPECPELDNLWLRNLVDTKVGFRTFAEHWLAEAGEDLPVLPFGIVTSGIQGAAEAAWWFLCRGRDCIIKADLGESGNGNFSLHAGEYDSLFNLTCALDQNSLLQDDLLVVEELIPSPATISPSLELFVPPLSEGAPAVTYLSNQIFQRFGRFAGVLIDRQHLQAPWYPPLERAGLLFAHRLQEMGYIGHFDLDAIVDPSGRIYLLEINARRTGGTYVHEFARHVLGENYLRSHTLLSQNQVACPGIHSLEGLLNKTSDLLFIPGERRSGIAIAVTSTIEQENFGCIFVGENLDEVQQLRAALAAHLGE